MNIFINEKKVITKNKLLFDIKNEFKCDADVIILNGFQVSSDILIKEEDKISLIKKGEIPDKDELERLMVSRHTPKLHEFFKKGRVAIAGCGGIGSSVAVALARLGIGYIKIIDFDLVEPSNLNRQQYFINQIGLKKTEALKENISMINPFIRVKTVDDMITKDNVYDIFEDVDIIVEAFDNPKTKAMLITDILMKYKDKKIVASSGMAGMYSNNIIESRRINSQLYVCGDFINEAKIGDGLMAPRVGIVANHQANIVARLLTGENEI